MPAGGKGYPVPARDPHAPVGTADAVRPFDIVILGAGSGAEWIWQRVAGRRIAVVESGRVGGECPFVACVPSKALLRAAQVRRIVRRAHELGALGTAADPGPGAEAFAAAVARRDRLAEHRDDGANAEDLEASGATLFRGRGRVAAPGLVEVEGRRGDRVLLGYGDLVIATGSRPAVPPVPGLGQVPTWTSDEALSSPELPGSLAVLGGGPVGCELAEIYASFGSAVTLIQAAGQLLPAEDRWVSDALCAGLGALGVDVRLGTEVTAASPGAAGAVLQLSGGGRLEVERVLVTTGRAPNTADLGLEHLGVEPGSGALAVDDRGRVAGCEGVWAAGDVTGEAPFTHTATYQSRLVADNLAGRARRGDLRAVPRLVYTDPPVAAVGLTERGAAEEGREVAVEAVALGEVARAATDGDETGELRVLADPASGAVVGAAAVGPGADELINQAVLAMRAGVHVAVFADAVRPFPTYSEAYDQPLGALAARLGPPPA